MRPLTLLFCLIFSLTTYAQKVVVTESDDKIEEIKRKGLYIMLELDEEVVKKQWQKKLRETGNLKTKSGIILVDQANLPSVSASSVKIVSKVLNSEKGTKVWYSIEQAESQYVTNSEASKFLHDFGVFMYIQDINEQIKEAEKVLAGFVKEQEKILVKGENIKNNIYKNRDERYVLLQKLHDNDSTYKLIKGDSLQNVLNQKASAENVDKMKRAVDLVKAKITKVE